MKVFPKSRLLVLLLLFFSQLILMSCTDGESQTVYVEGTSDSNPKLVMPEALRRASLVSNNLSAYLTVDGSRKEMTIRNGVASFSGPIATGNKDIELEFLYDSANFTNPVSLVTAKITKNIEDNNSTFTFLEQDYSYTNSDTDSFTNVRELEFGTSPFDGNDFPNDLDDNYEDNDSFDTAYDVTGLEGVIFDDTTTGIGRLVAQEGILDAVDVFTITPEGDIQQLDLAVALTISTFADFFYFDSDGDLVYPDLVEEAESNIAGVFKYTLTFFDPPEGLKYYMVFFTDEDGDFTGTPDDFVSGQYSLGWIATR